MNNTGVLLLAHGSPDSVDEVPEFLLRVTGGRPLPPDAIEEVKRRYSLIGRSPLTEITLKQGELLATRLKLPVYVGRPMELSCGRGRRRAGSLHRP